MINYEETRLQDISLTTVKKLLSPFFSTSELKNIQFLYHGTYNVFEVNYEYIFRFPDKIFRNHQGQFMLLNEIKMLEFIKRHVNFAIPDPIYSSLELDCPFMGYEKIEGISLSTCYKNASTSQKVKLGRQVASFLNQLHSIPNSEISLLKLNDCKPLSPSSLQKEWSKWFESVQQVIFPILNEEQKNWTMRLFSQFLSDRRNLLFTPCLVHGDFDSSNILVDRNTFTITGIIDFEETRLFDPAIDLLFLDEGKEILGSILKNYQGLVDQSLLNRMRFFYGKTYLSYMEFGLKHGLTDMVKAAFQILEKNMRRLKGN
jgi:aminoglycoside 2''-phosphotransferase